MATLVLCCGLVGCFGGQLTLIPRPRPSVDPMWQLPADAYPSQHLFRAQYQGPDGQLGFRLTLYLAGADRYRMEASDTLGRRVWSLDVDAGRRAVFLDHREELYCISTGDQRQAFVPIAHLPLGALPRLILGRIPGQPVGEVAESEGKVSFLDAHGQRWDGLAEDGALAWWSLIQEGEAIAWWRRHDKEFIFSDRRGGQQVSWRRQVQESLDQPLEPLEIPSSYGEGACGGSR